MFIYRIKTNEMQHRNLSIFVLFVAFGFASCNEKATNGALNEVKSSVVTISGKVIQSCDDNTPVTNLEIYLKGDQHVNEFGCNPKYFSAITDSEGKFTFQYNLKELCKPGMTLFIACDYQNTFKSLLGDLPRNQKEHNQNDPSIYKDVIVYYKNTNLHVARLKSNKSYSEADTVFYDLGFGRHGELTYKFTVGPFVDNQIIDTFISHSSVRLHPQKIGYGFPFRMNTNDGSWIPLKAEAISFYPCGYLNPIYVYLPD
jgi:hypothetical protein